MNENSISILFLFYSIFTKILDLSTSTHETIQCLVNSDVITNVFAQVIIDGVLKLAHHVFGNLFKPNVWLNVATLKTIILKLSLPLNI